MFILSLLIYLLVGIGLARTPYEIKNRASAFLTKIVIPLVIIFNIATNRPGVFSVMLGMAVIMSVMLLIRRASSKDSIQNLNFCYLNIGWLGLPVASSLFGDSAAMVIIAAYVGSSLFGNSVGVGLMVKGQGLKSGMLSTVKTPPVVALLVGIACMSLKGVLEEFGTPIYEILKFLMSFLGMKILGIWLAKAPLKTQDFKIAALQFVFRSLTLFLLVSLFIGVCAYYDISLVTENKATMYLICLLPPAANIIVLGTHYMKSGRSAGKIASGTCISIFAIVAYICFVIGARSYFV